MIVHRIENRIAPVAVRFSYFPDAVPPYSTLILSSETFLRTCGLAKLSAAAFCPFSVGIGVHLCVGAVAGALKVKDKGINPQSFSCRTPDTREQSASYRLVAPTKQPP